MILYIISVMIMIMTTAKEMDTQLYDIFCVIYIHKYMDAQLRDIFCLIYTHTYTL